MNNNHERKPLERSQEPLTAEEKGVTLQLPLDCTTNDGESQELSLARLLRLRDALRTLEAKIGQTRVEFEGEISDILQQGGAGDD